MQEVPEAFLEQLRALPVEVAGDVAAFVPIKAATDGKAVMFTSPRAAYNNRYRKLFTVPVDGGIETELPVPNAAKAAYSPDGTRIARLVDAPKEEPKPVTAIDTEGGSADWIAVAAKKYHLDPARLIAVGFSNGANIAATLLQLSKLRTATKPQKKLKKLQPNCLHGQPGICTHFRSLSPRI